MQLEDVLRRAGVRGERRGPVVVLYDGVVGEDVTVDALSPVMKGERLPEGTRWSGIPSRPATAPEVALAPGQLLALAAARQT